MKQLSKYILEKQHFLVKKHVTYDQEYIDLGLPSGTLWCTHNLGANKPEDPGLYFQFGSIYGHNDAKQYSNFSTTIFDKNKNIFTDRDIVKFKDEWFDEEYNLLDEYDAANFFDNDTYIPTWNQIQELLDYTDYKTEIVNGVNCKKIIGKNGKHIYIPFGGHFYNKKYFDKNEIGKIMGKTFSEDQNAIYVLEANKDEMNCHLVDLACAINIRPVK